MTHYTLTLLFLASMMNLAIHTVMSQPEVAMDVNDEMTGSIDEMIINAANSSREFDYFYDPAHSLLKVEYDMVYTYDEYAEFQRINNETRRKRTAGIINGRGGGRRWTNNVVGYQLANHFTSRDRRTIDAAIADWERYTCLDFRQASSGNRIYMKNGGGCYSRVGMVGGAQELGLAPGCRVKGVVIHEIGHALGLHHEQTRPDRDSHVRIIRRNIPSRVYYNFQKNSWSTIMNMNIPYDYTSIMHYGKTAFSTNGGITIQTVNPRYQNVIGNRRGLSFGDIKSTNIMYNCKRHTRGCTKTDAQCPGSGFVGKNCQCVCDGGSLSTPTKTCSGTTTGGGRRTTQAPPVTSRPRPTQPPPSGCRDQHNSCRFWAGRGECRANPSYMHVYCKKSCNKCGGSSGGCKDLHYACPQWRRYNYCNVRYSRFVRANCPKSCGRCNRRDPSPGQCTDDNQHCASWASTGECRRNPAYMLQSCRRSCNQCNAHSPDANYYCQDGNDHCSFWAGTGQCADNPGYMNMVCRESCGRC